MQNKIDWNKVDKEFELDIQKSENAKKDIKKYREKKTSAKTDADIVNNYLKNKRK